jgi:hypothetical protein
MNGCGTRNRGVVSLKAFYAGTSGRNTGNVIRGGSQPPSAPKAVSKSIYHLQLPFMRLVNSKYYQAKIPRLEDKYDAR